MGHDKAQELPGLKRSRGRPATGMAKTPAERQATYRAKQAAELAAIKRHVTQNKVAAPVTPTKAYGRLEAELILANSMLLTRSNELDAARDQVTALKRALASAHDEIAQLKARKHRRKE